MLLLEGVVLIEGVILLEEIRQFEKVQTILNGQCDFDKPRRSFFSSVIVCIQPKIPTFAENHQPKFSDL